MEIFGITVDLLSLIPAVFASLLSIYNWMMLRKPANIEAGELISYGYISSEYHGGFQLMLPLLLHNSGSNRGMVTNIEVQLVSSSQSISLDVLGKAILNELDINQVFNFTWDSFESEGYRILLPTYPIDVEGLSSSSINLICQTEELPFDQDLTMKIETQFDVGKSNTISFPFYLSSELGEVDNSLRWYRPVQKN